MAFYEPTVNMSGRELRQLMTGITYPNATVQGLEFNAGGEWDSVPWDDVNWNQDPNPDALLDTSLIAPPFVYDPITNPTVYDVQGGAFTDGYGPEELVPGLLTDQLNFSVTTDGLSVGEYLNFRISVSKSGQSKVYNTNPYTQTVLSQSFVSTGSIADVIHVADVKKLVELKDYLVTTDAMGVVTVHGVVASKVTAISINSTEKFTWAPENMDTIIINIEGITVPTDVTVTIAQGNLILLQNEYIGFTSVNVADNTITGLQRGLMGTVTNSQVAAGTTVQSVLDRDMLPEIYYGDWWYGESVGGWGREPWSKPPGWSGSTHLFDGTLYQSTYAPAVFLKKTTAA
jgi:hypothetical protein